jgi:hypothetical protein
MTALVLRVDSLKGFDQKGLRMQVSFAGYEHEGNHLACVAFRVFDDPQSPLEGDAYAARHTRDGSRYQQSRLVTRGDCAAGLMGRSNR